jgi:hypothetical protein
MTDAPSVRVCAHGWDSTEARIAGSCFVCIGGALARLSTAATQGPLRALKL